MSAQLVQELAADGVPVALTCRVLHIPRSGLYDAARRPPSVRQVVDQALAATITAIHESSRATYGAPRVLPSSGSASGLRAGANASRG